MADVEKVGEVAGLEDNAAPQGMQVLDIDLAVQKRVVRKMDLNLMPLVLALCKSFRSLQLPLLIVHRSRLLSRPFQHWKCEYCRFKQSFEAYRCSVSMAADYLLHSLHPI